MPSVPTKGPFLELRRLWGRVEQFRGRILLGSFFSVCNKLFDLAPPVLIGLAVDVVVRAQDSFLAEVGVSEPSHQLATLAVLTFLVWGAESTFEYLYQVTWRNLAQQLQHDIRLRAYQHVQSLDMAALEEETSGRLMAVLNDDVNQLERFLDDGANTILQLVTTVVAVGAVFIGAVPTLAWMAFIPAPLILLASLKVQSALGPRYRAVRDQVARVNELLANNLGGLSTIKSYVTEEHEAERLKSESFRYQELNISAIRLSSSFVPLIRMAIVIGFILIMVYGGLQTLSGVLEVGTYSVLVFMTQRLLWPLTRLGTTLDLYRRSMASIERILELLDLRPTMENGTREFKADRFTGEVVFKDVHFTYPNSEHPVLEGLNLTVEEGTTLGVVGTTGSGKSTLVKLLLRLYDPQGGSIEVDGVDLREYEMGSLRRSVGLVSQEVFLFDGTIEDNIRYGSFEAPEERFRKVLDQAAVREFVDRLPEGLKTQVGERGVRLSGGQRQRIALARALLKDPPLLILDEATSAVDNETELAIARALEEVRRERTVIIVAHRLSTLRTADRVVVISDGRPTEDGTHRELLNSGGVYASLWRIQSGQ